jgi:hypothetical protein
MPQMARKAREAEIPYSLGLLIGDFLAGTDDDREAFRRRQNMSFAEDPNCPGPRDMPQ